MQLDEHLAAENVFHLRRGIDLIRRLDPGLYAGAGSAPFRGGVGSQFRHCIDFYRCFLGGIDGGRIDYGCRERDSRTETDPKFAVHCAERIVVELSRLDNARATELLVVRSELPRAGAGELSWSRSTLLRELQFLASHTIHHYALIVALLLLRGFEPEAEFADFGVAPSTLDHWGASRKLASAE